MPRGNPNQFIREGEFKCECGREFTKSQSLYAHQSKCKIHLGDRYDPNKHKGWNIGDARAWSRGRTEDDPVYGEAIRKRNERMRSGINNNKGKTLVIHDRSKFQRQSETRKKKYQLGELTPALGVGRGKYSYITYGNKTIMLRSTYEFIYALYLLYNGIEFEYETVRVPVVTDYRGRKTFLSDFLVGSTVIELKGFKTSKIDHTRKAFESAGYQYEVKYWKDISECLEYLRSKLDIDDILEKIRNGHDSRQYYCHNFNTKDKG